jgi:hypothetical protein
VTLGLFAKHVVIPSCDGGHEAGRDFRSLLDGLEQQFQPIGLYEEWLVVKIAECMWRFRRATRCESGSVRRPEMRSEGDDYNDDRHIANMLSESSAFTEAERQLRDTGTLSQTLYGKIAPLVEKEKTIQLQSEQESKPIEVDVDRDLFLELIADNKRFLDSFCKSLLRSADDRFEAQSDYQALVSEADMDRILRYEERMQRQIDWAVQRLLEAKERREPRNSRSRDK